MKWFSEKTIDIIQWIFIVVLVVMLIVQGINYRQAKKDLVTSAEIIKENTYTRIYESQKLNKLKKENKELYDSISKIQDVESGMIIKFVEKYKTDTITVNEFAYGNDSIYHYKQDNDTVNLAIDVKAKKLDWVKADFALHDKFVITNREKNGVNETTISHSSNTSINETQMWHRENKEKWYKKFVVGPQVGVGYGVLNKKIDVYVGAGVSYNF